MPLSEEAFTAIVDAGCSACRSKKLVIETLVAQRIPLLAGEPFGAPSWGYKGEDLVRGTYRITCAGCKKELFAASECPRCSAPEGVGRALESETAFRLPAACADCRSEQVMVTAVVPALVVYEGQRANKARARSGPDDPGFHAVRAECKGCHAVVEPPRTPCPVCAA